MRTTPLGTHDPHVDVGSERVRFRLLNASTARSYHIGFTDDRPFELVATDGGLLERPHRATRVPLSPGERAEVVAEFQPGERGRAPQLPAGPAPAPPVTSPAMGGTSSAADGIPQLPTAVVDPPSGRTAMHG